MFRQYQPDIVLMDLQMPEMNGIDAVAAICQEFPTARIIRFNTYDGDEDIYRGLHAGAKGYLLKDASVEELTDAIVTVCAGQKYIPMLVATKLLERMDSLHLRIENVNYFNLSPKA